MNMKRKQFPIIVCGMMIITALFQSCNTDDDNSYNTYRPTALVTVYPKDDNSFFMQLDEKTVLLPTNMKGSPYGKKEVRALVNYTEEINAKEQDVRNVYVNWIDSIRTKEPIASAGEKNDSIFGKDPIEIVKDWVTVAEDGFLTLRIRTAWGPKHQPHYINLLSGVNKDDALEFELRHHAYGDLGGHMGDALIAFNLNKILKEAGADRKIKLSWTSFDGKKTAEFSLNSHNSTKALGMEQLPLNNDVK